MHELPGFAQIIHPLSKQNTRMEQTKKPKYVLYQYMPQSSSALIAFSMHSSASAVLIAFLLYAFHAKKLITSLCQAS